MFRLLLYPFVSLSDHYVSSAQRRFTVFFCSRLLSHPILSDAGSPQRLNVHTRNTPETEATYDHTPIRGPILYMCFEFR